MHVVPVQLGVGAVPETATTPAFPVTSWYSAAVFTAGELAMLTVTVTAALVLLMPTTSTAAASFEWANA